MQKSIQYVILILWTCSSSLLAQDLKTFFKDANLFFATHIQHNSVPYNSLYKKNAEIDALVQQIASVDLSQATASEQKAFYINAYNLLVIKNVFNSFPISSPNEVLHFWDEIEFTVANKKNTLEGLKAAIFAQFADVRLNFVLVDGSISGAPIIPMAYLPNNLEESLDNRCIEILNNSKFVQYDKTEGIVVVSGIFKLREQDFKPSILGFINQFRVQKIDTIAKVKYDNYDWRLNNLYGDATIVVNKKKNEVSYSMMAPSATLPKKAFELNWYNGLFAVTYGDRTTGSRSSFLGSQLTATYGITGRLDAGLTFMLRSDRTNDLYDNSPFKVFEFERLNTPNAITSSRSNIRSDWGFSHVGAQVRFAPFKNIGLAFEQGVLFPIRGLPRDNTVDDQIYLTSQIFLSYPVNSKMYLFFAFTYWQGVKAGEAFRFTPPMLRVFYSYYFTPRFSAVVTALYFLEWGAGLKFMITPKFEIQAMFSYYLPIPGIMDLLSPGATSIMTYNAGLRYRF